MKEIIKLIKSDYYRYCGVVVPTYKLLIYLILSHNHCFKYSFWLRLSHRKNMFFRLAKFMHSRLSRKYSLQIPSTCKIGYGLYLGHGICMVINPGTIIGNNVNLSQFLNIGTNHNTPAVIGDNVYIGPHVSIVEDVKIGNNSCIGAGAVVVKDVPENATVAGVPAKVVSYKDHNYILNKWPVY